MPLMGPDAEGREGRGKAWGLCRLSGLRGATGSSCWGPQMLAGPCCGSQAACSGPLGGGTAEGLPCVDRYGGGDRRPRLRGSCPGYPRIRQTQQPGSSGEGAGRVMAQEVGAGKAGPGSLPLVWVPGGLGSVLTAPAPAHGPHTGRQRPETWGADSVPWGVCVPGHRKQGF